jgi:hypothetical protein
MCVCVGGWSGGGGGGRRGGGGGVPAIHPRRLPPQSFQHRWHSQPIRHRRTAAVAGSKAGRACACAFDGACAAAGRQRPDRRGRLLRGRRGGLDRCSKGRRSSLPHSAVGCKLCVRAVRIGAHIERGSRSLSSNPCANGSKAPHNADRSRSRPRTSGRVPAADAGRGSALY